MRNKSLRIFSGFILPACMVFFPWPVSAALAVLLIFVFPWYWEAVFFALIADGFLTIQGARLSGRFGLITFLFVIMIIVAQEIKSRIRISRI